MKEALEIWGKPEVLLSAPTVLNIASIGAGNDFSLTMNDFVLQMVPDMGPTSLTQVISFRVPFTIAADQQLIGYKQTLLFGLKRTPGVRVLIMVDLAGTAKMLEFDFAETLSDEQIVALNSIPIFSVQGLELGVGLAPPIADYAATISITIQRRSLQESGLVQIDSLDVRAITVNYDQMTL
jgi:hypothetical protein